MDCRMKEFCSLSGNIAPNPGAGNFSSARVTLALWRARVISPLRGCSANSVTDGHLEKTGERRHPRHAQTYRLKNMKTPNQSQSGASGTLLFADLILGHARRLENLATKQARLERFASAVEAGEAPHDCDLLGAARALRDAGKINDDALFFIVVWRGERSAEDIFETDRELNRLNAKIRAIEKREGLDEFDEFIPEHPDTPADWKALDAKWKRRYEEVEKIQDDPVHPLASSSRRTRHGGLVCERPRRL